MNERKLRNTGVNPEKSVKYLHIYGNPAVLILFETCHNPTMQSTSFRKPDNGRQ